MKARNFLAIATVHLGLVACSLIGRSTPSPDDRVLADSFFFGYAYIDVNGNGQLDPDDPPLTGALFTAVDALGISAGDLTNSEGHAMAWWPAGSQYPVVLRMEPPKDSGYLIVGEDEVVLEVGESSAEFLFAPPPESTPAATS